MDIHIYNSLTQQIERFSPLNSEQVSMYACGPTVYGYIHIGNFRTYFLSDIIARTLEFNGFDVRFVMNITDVGHLSDDGDDGEDKLERVAEKEGKSAREIAQFYTKHFLTDYDKLGLTKPILFAYATEYIQEQIDLVRKLEINGYTYKTSDGVYFDTSKFEGYQTLLGIDKSQIEEGARVEVNPEKRNPQDFALWKFSEDISTRWQEWDSPWGIGYPGWHIECSAMSMKELGEQIDIHIGGEDLRATHHPNEIAQSQAATNKKFVNYWVHGGFLKVDDTKMSRSLNNLYTISDLESKEYTPLALRYFYMSAHYRSPLNFTWTAISSSQSALRKIYSVIEGYKTSKEADINQEYMQQFTYAINQDFNMPQALSVLWDMLKSDIPEEEKVVTAIQFDKVFGFGIEGHAGFEVPENIYNLAKKREIYRQNGIWDKADSVRKEINSLGYTVEDVEGDFKIRRKI